MKNTYVRPYNKDQLYDMYITQNLTAKAIGKMFGMPECAVCHDLTKYDIHKPYELRLLSQGCRKDIDKDALYEYYIIQNHSNEETAEYFGIHERTLRRRLSQFGFRKSIEDQRKLRSKNMIAKYGTPEIQNSEYYRQNILPTMLENMKRTNLKKYGVEHVFQSPEIQQTIQQTCLEKYGVRNQNQDPEIRHRGFSRYYYNGEKFDSGWELALWIYAKDHNEEIEHEPERLEYFVYGKIHYYFPDFRYQGELVEIKGGQLINQDGYLVERFGVDPTPLLIAKTQCMRDNNVRVLKQEDVAFAIQYVNQKYGRRYLRSFKYFKDKQSN